MSEEEGENKSFNNRDRQKQIITWIGAWSEAIINEKCNKSPNFSHLPTRYQLLSRYLPTYPPTHPPTYPPTHLPTYQPTHLSTYPPTIDILTFVRSMCRRKSWPSPLFSCAPSISPGCLPRTLERNPVRAQARYSVQRNRHVR